MLDVECKLIDCNVMREMGTQQHMDNKHSLGKPAKALERERERERERGVGEFKNVLLKRH